MGFGKPIAGLAILVVSVPNNSTFWRTLSGLFRRFIDRQKSVVMLEVESPRKAGNKVNLPMPRSKVEFPTSILAAIKNEHCFVTLQEDGLVTLDLSWKFGGPAQARDKLLTPILFKSLHHCVAIGG